ncbi:hypothetical protein D3C83_68690 [compost metagenome]
MESAARCASSSATLTSAAPWGREPRHDISVTTPTSVPCASSGTATSDDSPAVRSVRWRSGSCVSRAIVSSVTCAATTGRRVSITV